MATFVAGSLSPTAAAAPADVGTLAVASAEDQCSAADGLLDGLSLETAEIIGVSTQWNTSGQTELTPPVGTDVGGIDFCEVAVTLTHGEENGFGPDEVSVWVWLPATWNGRIQAVGGGGTRATHGASSMTAALADGYAVTASDSGVTDDRQPNIFLDSDETGDSFNWQIFENWTYRGVWEGTLISQQVVDKHYAAPADYTYWNGCSNGGRQGLEIAQRFPGVFDGVMSAAPAMYGADRLNMTMSWPAMVQHDAFGGFIPRCKLAAMGDAVRNHCDADDGAVDGLVSTPARCDYEAALETVIGMETECGTITKREAEVVAQIFEGPRTADDRFVWYGHTPGVDLSGGTFSVPPSFALQNFAFADTTVDWTSHTSDDLVTTIRDRMQGRLELLASADPVLEPYRRSGGKLLMWHGEADGLFPAAQSAHYFDEVARVSGDRTEDFFRLFLAPGVNHCGGGTGHQPDDPFAALVHWVEDGEAPDVLPATLENEAGESHRNLCPYPQAQMYDGGPLTDAASFQCGEETTAAAKISTTVGASPVTGAVGEPVTVTAHVSAEDDAELTGVVDAVINGKTVASGTVSKGVAELIVPRKAMPAKRLELRYRGYGNYSGSQTSVAMRLDPATSTVKAKPAKKKVRRGGKLRVSITVRAAITPAGRVVVRGLGSAKARLNASGKATVVLTVPRRATVGKHRLRVVYRGSGTVDGSATKVTVRVR
ncbi:tannase/feruloyl esterase family alpha/beta hydrolase [Nocardioides alcanivorans]|uniref:tannase/feruloyl esterase family alpha/beta hydrolase n=1 Tax=Nocardioides alcanivorans TaxID=2897352 RepID=UPI001F48002F|nr:tannase/feruloyl esterase family alpha/beta hydrolase [Nocardioides alcanivorans]